ncbi:MAG: tetratricopeptide repeat protein [Candidatus Omnitrophota bacterium]|nr:tetratricopeptide repeat protein [Candidatus Omnitrophota bacterium]
MIEEEILELVDKGVGQNLELIKEPPTTENSRKELAKIMVAFANSGDGVILIGIDKNKHAAADVSRDFDIFKEIMKIDKDYCNSSVNPQVSMETIGGKQLGVIRIRRGSERPYYAEGDCYVRVDKQVYVASHSEIQNMYKKQSSFRKQESDSWAVETASYEDLDATKIDEYLKSIGPKVEDMADRNREKVLKDKGILIESGNRLVPTAAGLLMFGNDPQYFIISSGVRLVRFQGKNIGSVIVDQKEVKGTIPCMIDEAWNFIFKHMNTGAKIEGLKRDDFTEYPAVAVREAITNAVVHRDYSIENSQVRIFMFDDRIEIYTPGGLAHGVTVANMEYTQYSRNKFITEILMRIGKYIEKLGTGIRRIKLTIRQSELRDPIFLDSGVDFILTLFGPIERSRQPKKEEINDRIQRIIGPAITPQEMASLSKESRDYTNKGERYAIGSVIQTLINNAKKSKKILIRFVAIGTGLLLIIIVITLFRTSASDPVAQYYRASLAHNRGEYREAIDAYSRFLIEFPNSEKADSAQYYMAGCMDILGEDVGALNAYADLLKKYPKSRWAAYAYYWRGALYLDIGELDNAITEYQRVLKEYPDHPIALSAMHGIASCFYKQGKFQEAIDMYEKALDLAEASSEGYEYYQIGLCYLELGQKDKAKQMFTRIISSEKANPELLKEVNEKISALGM